MMMGFLKVLANVIYCIAVVVTVVNSSLDVYKYSKTEKTEDDKKKLKKYLGGKLVELVILSAIMVIYLGII
jgi:hypothetical protein